MDPGWLRLAIEFLKDQGLPILMRYHTTQEWCYRWCVFSYHERQTRRARLEKLLDMRESVESVRTKVVQLHTEGFMFFEPSGPFSRLARQLRSMDIDGPQTWLDEHANIRPECLMWLDRILYAIEIRSLRIADKSWRYAQKRQTWKNRAEALKKSVA
jgi:hypothetical protein